MEPHWDDMKVFLAVAREESLSGAGRQLKLDPATVGRRIARLESAYDTPLFAKSPQGYTLTAAGERLLSHGEQAEAAMRSASEALAGTTEGLTGQIRIGAPDGSANYLLPQVCAQISDENPELDIQILALPRIINLSRASYRKMVQNLWWAAGYNIVAIPLAAGVLAPWGIVLSPAVGAVLMSLSTIIVAVNAQLLRRVKL